VYIVFLSLAFVRYMYLCMYVCAYDKAALCARCWVLGFPDGDYYCYGLLSQLLPTSAVFSLTYSSIPKMIGNVTLYPDCTALQHIRSHSSVVACLQTVLWGRANLRRLSLSFLDKGRSIARAVSRRLPTAAARVRSQSGHVGFVMDKVALGHVASSYCGLPCQFSFPQFLHAHLSSEAGSIGQLVADVPSELSLIPPHEIEKKNVFVLFHSSNVFRPMLIQYLLRVKYLNCIPQENFAVSNFVLRRLRSCSLKWVGRALSKTYIIL
jgi:hypothetical protein